MRKGWFRGIARKEKTKDRRGKNVCKKRREWERKKGRKWY